MENIAYYNGKIAPIEEMMIPMNERSSYFGDGVYDAMFTIDHVPLQLDDHLRRFYRSAKKIEIEIPICQPKGKMGLFDRKIRSFLDAILEGGEAPVPTSQILYNQAILDGINRSAQLGEEIKIEIPEI